MKAIVFTLSVVCLSAKAQTALLQPASNLRVYNPVEVFSPQNPFARWMPEVAKLNVRDNEQIGQMLNVLAAKGIGYVDGQSEYAGSFDLYRPFMMLALDHPVASFGVGPDAKVGVSNFLLHDSVHQVIGAPGPRLSDFNDIESAKRRMINLIVRKEALATSWTNYWYAKWWYQWKHIRDGREPHPEFDLYNQGAFSLGPVTPKQVLQLQLSIAEGRVHDTRRLISNLYSPEFYRGAIAAGAPGAIPNLESYLGVRGQHLFLRRLAPSIIAYYVGLFEPFYGYFSLRKYAKALTEFYYTDWYVRWAEAFEYGQPLDKMDADLSKKMRNFEAGLSIDAAGVAAPGTFEFQYLRNFVVQLGRKFFELEYMLKLKNTDHPELANVRQLIGEAKALHKDTIAEGFESRVQSLLERASNIDVNQLDLGVKIKDNKVFWRDPLAILAPRPAGLAQKFNAVSSSASLHEPSPCEKVLVGG